MVAGDLKDNPFKLANNVGILYVKAHFFQNLYVPSISRCFLLTYNSFKWMPYKSEFDCRR